MALLVFSVCFSLISLSAQARDDSSQLDLFGMDRTWRLILFYHPTFWGGEQSLIDSPTFFLHPNGKSDSVAELRMFHQRIAEEISSNKPDIICKFPRRYHWLAERIPSLPRFEIWNAPCHWEKKFFGAKVSRVYVNFSSYFLESPSSYFGHVFVRLAQAKGTGEGNPYLDPVLNFSAVNADANMAYYILGGLTGQFHGIFEILPMHIKVQQYGNNESRDIWEYPMDLSENEKQNFLMTLEEVLPHYSDYYYLSRNCAFLLAKMFETVRPEFSLGVRLRLWSTPVNMLQRIVTEFGQKENFVFRPSNRFRYLEKFRALNPIEVGHFDTIMKGESISSILDLSSVSQAKVLDTTIEFIDFDNRLAGPSSPETMGPLRKTALLARAKNPEISVESSIVPKSENPALMLPEHGIGLGLLAQPGLRGLLVTWRPTLKDLISDSIGFKPGINVEMFTFRFFANKNTVDIVSADLLKVENYQIGLPYHSQSNLNFRVSYGHRDSLLMNPKGSEVEISINRAWGILDQIGFFQLALPAFRNSTSSLAMTTELAPGFGAIFEKRRFAILFFKHEWRVNPFRGWEVTRADSLRIAVSLPKDFELNGEAQQIGLVRSINLSFRKFL
jgi:hypothetical protein